MVLIKNVDNLSKNMTVVEYQNAHQGSPGRVSGWGKADVHC